ncbi:MAG: helicase-associated domain-containing protein [Chloroflexales bacterium]|nr:helicase-associated domain-containing protein [Chloroflexales bacterium]
MKQHDTTIERSFRFWLRTCTASERKTLAQAWGMSPSIQRDAEDATTLANVLLTPDAIKQMLATLNAQEYAALERVLAEGGQIPAAVLEREFGSIRHHEGYPNPRAYLLALQQLPSATERLFILGLIQIEGRGRQQRYSVPVDLSALLPGVTLRDWTLHLASVPQPPVVVEAVIQELEYNIVTVLGLAQADALVVVPERGLNKASLLRLAKRWGMSKDDLRGITYEQHWRYLHFLRIVLQSAGLLHVTADNHLRPTKATIDWLQAPRSKRLHWLVEGWVTSDWDELKRFLGISIKGFAFDRNLAATRRAILKFLSQAPPDAWIAWDDLIDEVYRVDPDFARPDGRYDTWRLVDYRGQSLDGFDHWYDVEGELLKATIGGSLRWLGMTDYGGVKDADDHGTPTAFRLNANGAAVLGLTSAPADEAYDRLVIQGTFDLVVPPHATPFDRFQSGRVAAWVSGSSHEEAEIYKITKVQVQTAAEHGIAADAIIAFLEQSSGTTLPPNVTYSLREWVSKQGQLAVRQGVILQSNDRLLLEQVRRDRRVRTPPLETLDAQTWLLGEGDAVKLITELRKAGYGLTGDVHIDDLPFKERDLTVLAAALKFYAYACAELDIESQASAALGQRIARLLTQRQRDTVDRIAHAALTALRQKVN